MEDYKSCNNNNPYRMWKDALCHPYPYKKRFIFLEDLKTPTFPSTINLPIIPVDKKLFETSKIQNFRKCLCYVIIKSMRPRYNCPGN